MALAEHPPLPSGAHHAPKEDGCGCCGHDTHSHHSQDQATQPPPAHDACCATHAAGASAGTGIARSAFLRLLDVWLAVFAAVAAWLIAEPAATAALLAASVALAGWRLPQRAARSLRRCRPDIQLLMTLAVIGAVFLGELAEAASVTILFAIAEALEAWGARYAKASVAALLEPAPEMARVLGDRPEAEGHAHSCSHKHDHHNHTHHQPYGQMIPVGQVVTGAKVYVLPGERIPVDGVVLSGESTVNEAALTGEPLPQPCRAGEAVLAGAINGPGALTLVASRPGSDTTLARMLRLMQETRSRRAPAEQMVQRFALYYTPAMIALAGLIAVVPPLVLGRGWGDSLYGALVVLVIGCPCALVIAAPTTIAAGLACAARRGVLVKGGAYLELPARLRAIAFDKTGTLTEGKPLVVAIEPLDGQGERELLHLAAQIEVASEHPIGRAIVAEARRQGWQPDAEPPVRAEAWPGEGIRVVLSEGDSALWAGTERCARRMGIIIAPDLQVRLDHHAARGEVAVMVGDEAAVAGIVALRDAVRPSAAGAIRGLRAAGIEEIRLLTGDREPAARRLAEELKLDHYEAALLPDAKLRAVEAMMTRWGTVAMMGDGLNDAPALAASSLGVAVSAAASPATLETADVALLGDDLTRLPWLVLHSRRTLGILRQNIALAVGTKGLFMLLAAMGHATMWMAVLADTGLTVVVVLNSLRALHPGRDA